MNPAVALVDAYLKVNGYFTVTEYPVIERQEEHGFREATDLDLLAFRFPEAARVVPGGGAVDGLPALAAPDPALGADPQRPDMIIAEVKEGKAELNRGARRRPVLVSALVRFGCCRPGEGTAVAETLLRKGRARTGRGHGVRLLAFGSFGGAPAGGVHVMTLGHVLEFLEAHIRDHWDVLRTGQFGHPALGLLITLEKARRGDGPDGAAAMPAAGGAT